MEIFWENRHFIENLKQRIREEYQASNVRFIEQTNHFCKFRGVKDSKYALDKSCQFGFIIESED